MGFDNIPQYWRRANIYLHFIGSKCKQCGKKTFPPLPRCPYCGGEMEKCELPRGGKLLAWSVVQLAPQEWREQAPFIVGLIELDDGTRVIAQITDVSVDELKEGMRVRATIRRAPEREDEVIRYIVKFVPDWFNEE